METQNFQTGIVVNATAQETFDSINSVSRWWTENLEGNTQKPGDEFTVRFGDVHYSRQKLTEVVPGKKVVWLVTDSKLNFLKDKREWTNTKIVFEIFSRNSQTEVRFTHIGLVPQVECFDACSNAWGQYIQQSLFNLITTGKGQPDPREDKALIGKE